MNDQLRPRALRGLLRYREPQQTPHRRITAAMETDLLRWAATLDDQEMLDMRNIGRTLLAWIRAHEPEPPASTLGSVMQSTGWRVEVLWNGSAGWFTARMVSLRDKNGMPGYEGGYLVPFDDPIGASGATPAEALANLQEAVLEWA